MSDIQGLAAVWERYAGVAELQRGVARGESQIVFGLSGSAGNLLLAQLSRRSDRSIIVVTPDAETAYQVWTELEDVLGADQVKLFPSREAFPYQLMAHNTEITHQRLAVLAAAGTNQRGLVVAPVEALLGRLIPAAAWLGSIRKYHSHQEVNWEKEMHAWVAMGYQRVALVEQPGQFSVRGGIIDLYSPQYPNPFRIELFGDSIENIREFDTGDQRSRTTVTAVDVIPAAEFILNDCTRESGLEVLEQHYQESIRRLKQKEARERLSSKISTILTSLRQGGLPEQGSAVSMFFYSQLSGLWDYYPSRPVLALLQPGRIIETVKRWQHQGHTSFGDLLLQGSALPRQREAWFSQEELLGVWQPYPMLAFALLPRQFEGLVFTHQLSCVLNGVPALANNPELLVGEIGRWKRRAAVIIVLPDKQQIQRLQAGLKEREIATVIQERLQGEVRPGQVIFTVGHLAQGFELPELRVVVLTEKEIYGTSLKRSMTRTKQGSSDNQELLRHLQPGDYVVHEQHGIGRYLGITELQVEGISRDYLLIQYAGEDRLYVPTDQMALVQQYLGQEGHTPRLHRLNSSEWGKTKLRVKHAVEELAEQLLELYAYRETIEATAFGPDTPWQQEFEAFFPYEETTDQLRAIDEVKQDMSRGRPPMDRLLCGDVGYGKTEVALRAAFKAIMGHKQVAVLVPTTVLAQQHYRTFCERFSPFPVRVEVISRFRSASEQREILRLAYAGEIDIVIGTHRLLSADVQFKDLGLVVVDEEQRFGVTHKERLKQLCLNVHVLTLSATPIPRTLYMALTGVRDMSVIGTPPKNRLPVQTFVAELNPDLIKNAVSRELERQGQIYYVHNRIEDIERTSLWLRQLLPEVRIIVAHGRLPEDILERNMWRFAQGEADLLLCTTIVENGLDLPNVNTLIVEDADRLGLSQLYQVRGRVGRADRPAWAYFTYRPQKVLSEIAEKRLSAIREFTELGAGFKLSMRDLELRGAGNLLGAEQHGHMLTVGFSTYCQLLEEAVVKSKGQKTQQDHYPAPAIELQVDAYMVQEYVLDHGVKMELYQRLAAVSSLEKLNALEEELLDRFGEPPLPVANLVAVVRIRILAQDLGVESIRQHKGMIHLVFRVNRGPAGARVMELVTHFPRRISFVATDKLEIKLKVAPIKPDDILPQLLNLLYRLQALNEERSDEQVVLMREGGSTGTGSQRSYNPIHGKK